MSGQLPAQGTVQQDYVQHLVFDAPAEQANSAVTQNFQENQFGHRSGSGNATPWGTPPGRPLIQIYTGGQQTGGGVKLRDNWQATLRQDGNPGAA